MRKATMKTIQVKCPYCETLLEVDTSYCGLCLPCPGCSKQFLVPSAILDGRSMDEGSNQVETIKCSNISKQGETNKGSSFRLFVMMGFILGAVIGWLSLKVLGALLFAFVSSGAAACVHSGLGLPRKEWRFVIIGGLVGSTLGLTTWSGYGSDLWAFAGFYITTAVGICSGKCFSLANKSSAIERQWTYASFAAGLVYSCLAWNHTHFLYYIIICLQDFNTTFSDSTYRLHVDEFSNLRFSFIGMLFWSLLATCAGTCIGKAVNDGKLSKFCVFGFMIIGFASNPLALGLAGNLKNNLESSMLLGTISGLVGSCAGLCFAKALANKKQLITIIISFVILSISRLRCNNFQSFFETSAESLFYGFISICATYAIFKASSLSNSALYSQNPPLLDNQNTLA